MNGAMKLSIDEVLNEAIMSSTPAIIVEGIDDLKTYISIAKSAVENFEIYPVETIDGYSAGCQHVVNAIRDLYSLNDATHPIENFVLGIIDRDVREFRNEIPEEEAILALEYYSLESHFVCEEVLSAAIRRYAKVHSDKLGPEFSPNLFSQIEEKLLDLYYFSLESLRCAIDSTYSTEFKYSYKPNRRTEEPTRTNVLAKIEQLDQLADQFGLSRNIQCLKKIAKGKWLLQVFSEAVYGVLQNLHALCGKFGATQCEFCRLQIADKCTYRAKEGISSKTVYSDATENTSLASLEYVRQRISSISLQSVPAT